MADQPNRAIIEQALAKRAAAETPAIVVPTPEPVMSPAPAPAQLPLANASTRGGPVVMPDVMAAQPNAPVALPEPQATQVAEAILPQPEMPVGAPILRPEEIDSIAQPTTQQVDKIVAKVAAPLQQFRAESLALDKVEELRKEMDQRQQAREADLKAQFDKMDAQVRQQSFGEIFKGGSTGDKLLAALSIALGGASQALTGARTNPAIDFMNQLVEQQAQKDQLTNQQKEMLRKQVYDAGALEAKRLEDATNNAFRKDQLRLQQQELAIKAGEIQAKLEAELNKNQNLGGIFSGKELTPEQLMQVRADKNLSRNLVTLPNGKAYLANNARAAGEFDKFATESFNALANLQKYMNLAKSGSKLSLKDQAEAKSLQQAIVGALRLPFTGPGVLTDTERAQLLQAIGKPLGWMTLRSMETKKIQTVVDALKANTINKARLSGVSGDIFDDVRFYKLGDKAVREDDLVKAYQQKMPNLSEDKIRLAIQRQVPTL